MFRINRCSLNLEVIEVRYWASTSARLDLVAHLMLVKRYNLILSNIALLILLLLHILIHGFKCALLYKVGLDYWHLKLLRVIGLDLI